MIWRAALLLATCTVARAGDRGGLSGLIQDTSGGVLVAAGVTVMDQDSGIRRVTQADGEGAYAVFALPAGQYKVTVRRSGFQTIVRWNVKVEPDQNARLDFVMQVGSMQQTIEIRSGPPPINTDDGSSGTVVRRDAIESLPLNGRGLLSVVELSPGVVTTPAAEGEAGQFSVNGLRPNTNYFTVDGISANTSITGAGLPAQFAGAALPAMTAFGSADNLAPADELDEVRLLTSSFAPEFGRAPGGQVALTTRSGSDRYHASGSYALRNELFNANDEYAQSNRLARGASRLHQWSADFGGPLVRNRTFFFASYEGQRLDQPFTIPLVVPSIAARVSAPMDVRPVLNAFPVPDMPLPGGLLGELVTQYSRPARLDAAALRIDHGLSQHVSLFGRYNWSPSSTQTGFTDVESLHLRSSSFTLGIEAVPEPSITNEARLNVWWAAASSVWTPNPASGAAPLDFAAILPSAPGAPPTFYGLAIGGMSSLSAGGSARSRQGQLNLLDTLSAIRGTHTIRAGIDYQRLTPARESAGRSVTGWWPDLSHVLAASPPLIGTTTADQASALVETFSIFAQDTWRLSPRLNLTYGLRWEITPAPAVRGLGASASSSAPAAPIAPVLPVAPLTQPLWGTNYGQLAPRAGAAFRLDSQSVVRAGWGIFYDTGFGAALDPINGFPFNRWQFTLGGSAPPNGPGYGLRSAPNLRLPYAEEWNVSWERMFGMRNVVAVSYIASQGHRLLRYEGILQPGVNAAQVASATNDGRSHYQSLAVQFRRRLSPGLQGIAAYTWSHSIDNGSFDSAVYLAAQQLSPASDIGSSSFDVRQNLNAGIMYAGVRHWNFSALLHVRSGFPIDVLTHENFFGLGFDDVTRPDLVPGVRLWEPAAVLGGRALNPAAFSEPSGIQGGLGRNAIAGFGMTQFDLEVAREFRVSREAEFQLRLDAYNALNHPNPADPDRFLDSPHFGTSTSMLNLMLGSGTPRSGLAPAFQIGGGRVLQFSLKMSF
ncbi:MAG TPA: TonB-dependent receptor [Bryobacteraceae bacterium]|nr:TonB-dependent receptor [Bryobacteraceae bacterium]